MWKLSISTCGYAPDCTIEDYLPRIMIRVFDKQLRVLHLHDNFGMITPVHPDQHLFPGTGTIDFSNVFSTLKEINFCGTINLEPGRLERLPVNIRDAAITGGALIARAYIGDIC